MKKKHLWARPCFLGAKAHIVLNYSSKIVCFCFSPNFFILDEPTNHLDMETIEALGIALNKFEVRTLS